MTKEYDLLFHDEGPYHTETSPLVCLANQWTCFYMTGTSVMKELKHDENMTSYLLTFFIYSKFRSINHDTRP